MPEAQGQTVMPTDTNTGNKLGPNILRGGHLCDADSFAPNAKQRNLAASEINDRRKTFLLTCDLFVPFMFFYSPMFPAAKPNTDPRHPPPPAWQGRAGVLGEPHLQR